MFWRKYSCLHPVHPSCFIQVQRSNTEVVRWRVGVGTKWYKRSCTYIQYNHLHIHFLLISSTACLLASRNSLLTSKKNTEHDVNIHKFSLKLMLSKVDFNKLSTAHTVCRTWSSFRCEAKALGNRGRGTGRSLSAAGWSHLSCRRQRLPDACTEWVLENWKPE